MTGTAEVIQLAAFRSKPGKVPREHPTSNPQCEEGLTETGKNLRLRKQRYADWRRANSLREYWRASLKMNNAISIVQSHGLPEGELHPKYVPEDHWTLVAKWRAAVVQQLLTPAPTAGGITWKRAAFRDGQHKYTDIKPERIERAIADDVEFLKAHPTRRSRKREQEQ
jgi:hypothetical protein